jgi:hypothetical protein
MKLHRIVLAVAALSLLAAGACNRDATAGPPASQSPTDQSATDRSPASESPTSAPPVRQVRPKQSPPPPVRKVVPPLKKVRPVAQQARLSPRGLGPYTAGTRALGLKLGDLLADYGQDAQCPDGYYGTGTLKYHSPHLVFTDGAKLVYISVDSPKVATTAGVRIGTPFATVKRLHPDGRQYDNEGLHAWVVTKGADALVIRIENGKVSWLEAGEKETVVFRFTDGEGC